MARKDESPKTPPAKKPAAQPDLPLDEQPGPLFEAPSDPALEKVPDPEWYESGLEPFTEEDDDRALTTGDFHNIAQKQILNAVFAVLSETKMDWAMIEPFLAAARDVLLGDIEENAQIRLHTVQQDAEGGWVEADEAYLGISVSDREQGEEWLSDTRWLSEIAIAEDDPEQVRAIVGALERTIAKLNLWLADKSPAPSAPTA